jgi:hypothetical protein
VPKHKKKPSQIMGSIYYTQDLVDQIKLFLDQQEEPDLPRNSRYKFLKRYGDGTYKVKDDKLLHNGKIVVPKENIQELLQRLFEDPLYMQTSAPRFHARISTEYEGISRSDCQKFLDNKKIPQMFKRLPKFREVTPICTQYPREQFNV